MSDFSGEQVQLRNAVRALVAKHCDSAAVRRAIAPSPGYDTEVWQLLCAQIGVAALAVPEANGGIGAGGREIALVMEELGRTLTPSPMLGSVLAAALLTAVDDDAAAPLLERVAEGAVAAVAWAGPDGRWEQGAVRCESGRLTGAAEYVLDGDTAQVLLVVADGAVYEVSLDEAERVHTPTMDPTRRLARVSTNGAQGRRIGPADASPALRAALEHAVVALAAEQVGVAAGALQMTVEYTKARRQFGRPIGSFQALKHRMADLHVLLEGARSAAYAAADGHLHPSVARAYCARAAQTITAEAIQLHGGIAITWEHDAHLYFKRAHGSAILFGSVDQHVQRLSEELG